MVKIITSTQELEEVRLNEKGPVGFVPTMGNLHSGHISLLERALSEFEIVYFSIFVNPKQFGPNEDFNRYPRTLEADVNQIERCAQRFPNSRIMIYAPKSTEEVFPISKGHSVSVLGLSSILEGSIRPGHFDGMATVVLRLFELIKPTRAYFGLKDYQQLAIIKQMVRDLALPIEIIGMPIIRDTEGLALSSRNQYLSPGQKKASLILFESLSELKKIIAGKRKNIPLAQKRISEMLQDKNWNYLELRDAVSLSSSIEESKELTLLAVYQLGATRLLDNMQMEIE